MRNHPLRFLVLAALAVGACNDHPLTPTAPDAVARAPYGSGRRDAGIAANDSWLTAQVTTTTAGAVVSEFEFEGGYGRGGELRAGIYWTPKVAGVALAGIRYIGDRVELLNAAGGVIGTNSFNGHMTEIGLPGGTLVGAILQTQDPGDGSCHPKDLNCPATLMADPAAHGGSAPSADERRLRRRIVPARTSVALSGAGDFVDIERVYRRQRQSGRRADLWRLEEIVEERRTTGERGPRVTRSVTRIRYTRYQMKAEREAARSAAFRAAAAPESIVRAAASPVQPSANDRDVLVPRLEADADGLLDPFCQQGMRNEHVRMKRARGGLSLVFQHGFCSDASAFDGFRPRLATSLVVDRERAYSLNSTEAIESQTTDLAARIAEGGPSRNIVIGHSQGGLVARRFGQRYPEYVSGVVTIGSPQTGSLLAALGPSAIDELVASITAESCATAMLCAMIEGIVEQQLKGRLSVALLENGAPSLHDMVPDSPFLTTLNSTFEPFARASVETSVGNRWAIARMIGDGRSPVSNLLHDQRPAGDAWVTWAEYTYWSAQSLRALALFGLLYTEMTGNGVNCSQSAYLAYWQACTNPVPAADAGASWWQQLLALNTVLLTSIVIEGMNVIDHAWDYATTRRQEGTDGLIHRHSQRYPSAPGAFAPERYVVEPPHADSHSGQLASPTTLQRTLDALRSLATKNP